MEPLQQVHKSYLRNKYAYELQYAIEQHKMLLKTLETELRFYEFLLDSCKTKSPVMHVFEGLIQFKIDIATSNKNRALLLNEIRSITIKNTKTSIENSDLIISKLESLEAKIDDFNTNISHLKFSIYEYLQKIISS